MCIASIFSRTWFSSATALAMSLDVRSNDALSSHIFSYWKQETAVNIHITILTVIFADHVTWEGKAITTVHPFVSTLSFDQTDL